MPVPSETVAVGAPAPDFSLPGVKGRALKLSRFRGKPVVLVFLRGFF